MNPKTYSEHPMTRWQQTLIYLIALLIIPVVGHFASTM